MTDGKTNEGDTPGEGDNPITPPVEAVPPTSNEPSPLDRAEAANKEKAALLDREEKLQDRKEKVIAEEIVGGRARMGTIEQYKIVSPEAADWKKIRMDCEHSITKSKRDIELLEISGAHAKKREEEETVNFSKV